MSSWYGTKKERHVCDALFSVGLPGLEPGKAGPESAVLPLHHSPITTGRTPFCAAKVWSFSELTKLSAKKI